MKNKNSVRTDKPLRVPWVSIICGILAAVAVMVAFNVPLKQAGSFVYTIVALAAYFTGYLVVGFATRWK